MDTPLDPRWQNALSHGRYLCASETNGVTCADTRSGRGFRVARAGVVLF